MRPMIGLSIFGFMVSTGIAGNVSADAHSELMNMQGQAGRALSTMHTLIGYKDDAERIAVAQQQGSIAEADQRVQAYGASLYTIGFRPNELADRRAGLLRAMQSYLGTVSQAVSTSQTWPPGDAEQWRSRATNVLNSVNSNYQRYLQSDVDPAPLLSAIARVAGWARGEAQAADPFAGHKQRVLASIPDARAQGAVAATEARVDATSPTASTVQAAAGTAVGVGGVRVTPGEMGVSRTISAPPVFGQVGQPPSLNVEQGYQQAAKILIPPGAESTGVTRPLPPAPPLGVVSHPPPQQLPDSAIYNNGAPGAAVPDYAQPNPGG